MSPDIDFVYHDADTFAAEIAGSVCVFPKPLFKVLQNFVFELYIRLKKYAICVVYLI